jgi:hypothetical protein
MVDSCVGVGVGGDVGLLVSPVGVGRAVGLAAGVGVGGDVGFGSD